MTLEELERSTSGQVIARRNLAVGLWAGQAIGLKGRALNSYVMDVMRSDHDIPGPDDMIDKISCDFIKHDVNFQCTDIEHQIRHQEFLARLERVQKS